LIFVDVPFNITNTANMSMFDVRNIRCFICDISIYLYAKFVPDYKINLDLGTPSASTIHSGE